MIKIVRGNNDNFINRGVKYDILIENECECNYC